MFASVNPFLHAYLRSDLFGKGIFIFLLSLSILSWVFLLHKIWILYRLQKMGKFFSQKLEKQKKALLDPSFIPSHHHPYSSLVHTLQEKTVEILEKNRHFSKEEQVYLSGNDLQLIESHLFSTLTKECKQIEKNLFILPTTVTLAPFLGLLGTVWGILVTFSGLQTHSVSSSNATVLSGLSLALTTTVLGLLIAIPALIAHSYLKNSAKELRKEMELFSHFLLTSLELQYRKVDV